MISAYDWEEYYLLLTVRNASTTKSFLLNHVSQDVFFEKWMSLWDDARYQTILMLDVLPLTEESFEMLEPIYSGDYLLE